MITIRDAKQQDRDDIRKIYLNAFGDAESKIVAELACNLLGEDTTPHTLALVAENNGSLAGHIAFSPVTFDSSTELKGYILAPLAVKPEFQHCGIGSQLVESGIARLSKEGVKILFVYGDPKYYNKFGFKAETAAKYIPPYKLQYPFGWLARVLHGEDSNPHTVKISCVASLRIPELW